MSKQARNRPTDAYLLAPLFLLGGTALYFMPQLPHWGGVLSMAGVGILLLVIGYYRFPWRLLAMLLLGFAWTAIAAHHVLDWELPQAWVGKNITVTGYIASLPQSKHHGKRFVFAVEKINQTSIVHPVQVQLSAYGMSGFDLGDRWRLQVRLHSMVSMHNPGGFDRARWFFQRRIRATGYILSYAPENQRLVQSYTAFPMARFRQYLARQIHYALRGSDVGGIIASLTVGDRQGITPAQWQVFRRTGTAHLVAISGLHIGLIAALFFWIGFRLVGLFPRLVFKYPAQQYAGLLSLFFSLLYSGIAGFAISTERALLMIGIVIALQQIRYITTSMQVFLTTLMLVLLLNPLAIFSLSFWLSFWAVAVILYAIESMPACMTSGWQKILWMQTILLIGMLPLNLWLFEQTSMIGFVANLIAIPYVSFIVIPTAIAGSILISLDFNLGQWVFMIAAHALGYLWWLLNWFSSLPIAIWHHPIVHPWVLVVLLAGGVVLVYPKPIAWYWRILGLMGILPLLLIGKPSPHAGDAWVTALAVKKGFIDVVRTQSHTLVWCHAKGSFSERLWQQTLKHQGINPAHAHVIGIKNQHNALWQNDGVIFKQICQHPNCHLLLTAHHKTIMLPEKRKNHQHSALILRITDKGVSQFFYGARHRHFWDR